MFKKAAVAVVPNYLKETHNFLMSVVPIRFQGGRFAAEKPKKVQNVFSGKLADDGQKEEGAKIGNHWQR